MRKAIQKDKHGEARKIRLGEILVQQKLITEEQLQPPWLSKKRTGRNGRVFVENRFIVTEDQISQAMKPSRSSFVNFARYNIKPDERNCPSCRLVVFERDVEQRDNGFGGDGSH